MTMVWTLALIHWAGIALVLVALAAGQVSRGRLERFADRQQLAITAANGARVIRYLATTRRWRIGGLVGGVLVAEATEPHRAGQISTAADWIMIFVGWFIGAVIAEVRIEHLEHGPIRAASLQRRRPDRYVRRFAWALVPAAAVVALLAGATTAVAGTLGWAEPDWTWAATWLAAALAVAATVRAIQHAVLRRPQPLAEPDVIDADDAIRSRSLHVLSAAGTALVLFLVLNQIGSIHPVGIRDSVVISIRIYGIFGVALLGWLVGTSMWPPPAAAEHTGAPASGTA